MERGQSPMTEREDENIIKIKLVNMLQDIILHNKFVKLTFCEA